MEKIGRIIVGAGCILIIVFLIIKCIELFFQKDWVGALGGTGFTLLIIGLLICFLDVLFNGFR